MACRSILGLLSAAIGRRRASRACLAAATVFAGLLAASPASAGVPGWWERSGSSTQFGDCYSAAVDQYYAIYGAPWRFEFWSNGNFCSVYGYKNNFQGSGHGTLECPSGYKKYGGRCLDWQYVSEANPEEKTCGTRQPALIGNPVRPLSGSKHETEVDYTTSGPKPLSFVRYYGRAGGGLFAVGDSSRLGRGWRSNYDVAFMVDGSWVFITIPDGQDLLFMDNGGGTYVRGYVAAYPWFVIHEAPRDASEETLQLVSGNYELHDANDTVWVINSSGRLIEIRERGGYVRTLTYDGSGNNTLIEDSFGRQLELTYDDEGRLTTLEGPGGDTYTYTYDERPNFGSLTEPDDGWGTLMREWSVLETVTRPDTETRTYHYEDTDFPFALTGITDERGIRYSTFAYDSNGRPISSEHAGGKDLFTFDYDDANDEVTVTNPLGKETVYSYTNVDTSIRVLSEVIGEASPSCPMSNSTMEYDSNTFLSAIVDEEGRRTEMTNNSRGLPEEIIRAEGTADEETTTYTWHADFRVPTEIVAPGLTSEFTYDTDGSLTEVEQTDTTTHTVPYTTAGATRTWAYTYTTGGLVDTIDGPLAGTGDTIDFDYDADGFLDDVTNEAGHVTDVVTVNDRGQPTEIEDPNGMSYTLAYDDIGRLESFTADLGWTTRTTEYDYDEIGAVTKVTLPDGSFLEYDYDNARRLESVENNAGERIEYDYDDAGNMIEQVVKDGASAVVETQTRTFDELSRLLTLIDASTQTWTYSYDKVDNLVEVEDPRSNTFGYAYDALNRLVELTDEDSAVTTLTRAETGEVETHEDPNVVTTTYVRNGWGEVIREESPDTGTVDYVRNALGLITEKTDARGIVSEYSYDDLGRLTAITYPTSAEDVAYVYDDTTGGNLSVGQLTSVDDESGSTTFEFDTRPGVAEVTTTIGSETYPVAYDYDAAGRLGQITYPSGRQVSYWYDSTGRPASIGTRESSSDPWDDLATNIAVHPFAGTWTALLHMNGVNDWRVLDDDGRVSTYGSADGATDLLGRALGYTDGINLNNVWDQINSANDEEYWYTASNRVQNTSGPWGDLDIFTDGAGNRTSQELDNGSTTTNVYDFVTGTNRVLDITTNSVLSREFTYDNAGNTLTDTKASVTTTYSYNDAGRMEGLTVGSSGRGPYLYNAFGQLALRQVTAGVPASAIHMLYDQDGNLIAEANASTGVTMREYVWFQGRPVAVIDDVDTSNPVIFAVHADHLDRPVMMTDASKAIVWRATYKPFGEVHSITGSQSLDYRFPGQWFMLETGLHYNWHRWYDASLGRYTQPDPLGMPDGPSRYAYAKNSPLMYVDPDGQITLGPLFEWLFGHEPNVCPVPDGAVPFDDPMFGGDDDCDAQAERDEAICRSLPNPGARARCWESANARFGACRAGKSLPPLITW